MSDHAHDAVALAAFEAMGRVHPLVCVGASHHAPKPIRLNWHHVLPKVCGGPTVPDNLIGLCDNCHISIHVLMWQMAHGVVIKKWLHPLAQLYYATRGYDEAVAMGTQLKLPNLYTVVEAG